MKFTYKDRVKKLGVVVVYKSKKYSCDFKKVNFESERE